MSNFLTFIRRNLLLFIFGLFMGHNTWAYQWTCNGALETSPDLRHEYEAQILATSAIGEYKKVMGLTELGDRYSHLDIAKFRLASVDPSKKKKLLEIISSIYYAVKSLKGQKEGQFKRFKRHLDIAISAFSNASEFFKDQIVQKHQSVEAALNSYFRNMQQLIDGPVILTADDIHLTALRVQDKYLKDRAGPIYLYGSFVNGKAVPRVSDLDFAVTDFRLENEMESINVEETLPDFQFTEAQGHLRSNSQVHSLGYLNPLVLVVHSDHVILRVYENKPIGEYNHQQVRYAEYYF